MDTNLKSEERLDDLQVNGYEIIQHPGKFCFGMDAVLSRFCLQQRRKGNPLSALKSKKKVLIWRGEVWRIIIWKKKWRL